MLASLASGGDGGAGASGGEVRVPVPLKQVFPLNVQHGAHRANSVTVRILDEAGGLPALRRFTTRFYKRAFADPHIDLFIRSHDDPHGERFSTWIAEKFGHGQPWSQERSARPRCPVSVGHGHQTTVHDRSSAHFAAWHSPKREDHKWGNHFGLEDCRVWMRLHFWAAREEGLFKHAAFADYYVRFIGHFVSVYERSAPQFARESARWSVDLASTQRYLDSGRRMDGVVGISHQAALSQLPAEERLYTGSAGRPLLWPYA